MNAEQQRVAENNKDERWHLWGPYLAERAWGTVREDYSANGDAWNYFPHDQARSRVFRWGEDGIGGISDFKQRLCLAFAFWNGRDAMLKERLFGVTGPQGSHGEDVKEIYFYTDCTPTHSYMRMLYRYPQTRFPYEELVTANHGRPKHDPEVELWDMGVLREQRYFDISLEYAKVDPDDFFIRVTATNRGPEPAELHVLPTLWFRNTWAWGRDDRRPVLRASSDLAEHCPAIQASHHALGDYELHCADARELLFTGNETNSERLFSSPNRSPFVKDGINDFIVQGRREAVNPECVGTKAAAHYAFTIQPGASEVVRLWFGRVGETVKEELSDEPGEMPEHVCLPVLDRKAFENFESVFQSRKLEADEFYDALEPASLSAEHKLIHRQALAGMLWSKQFYHYVIEDWLQGDPGQPAPPPERKRGRNAEWRHLYNERVMSMPDKWEYPWYAAWDLAFHCLPLALVDPLFAKGQLDIILREWYQHPNGQVPAYEWNFGDVNPPVIGWAAWRVYKIEEKQTGRGDRDFLETAFHKLLIGFTWWVNRKDSKGKNIFQGGFLGLDNIGVFDRSAPLPDGGHLEQSDGTSWMGMFCLNMMRMALELARQNPVYENIATKFFEHFLGIAGAMNDLGGQGIGLWDEPDEFYYDVLHMP
ncbi:MAG TPA: hypothetical protein VEX43_00560, partial [Chthoniobacterales bacterium]|nr:hypothetical protein [Chthoniobacterales bacterium]